MRDTELYRHLLGLVEPWTVDRVDLDLKQQRVDVWASHPEGTQFPCPECGTLYGVRDHVDRTWRHLDSCQFQTFLHCRVPRVECRTHKVKQVRVPWAEPGSQFTTLFERLAIDLLRECAISGAAGILRISWDEAWGIVERAVGRGQARKAPATLRRIGIDEKAFKKGHHYLTLVVNAEEARVEYIGEDRKQASLDGFFQSLTAEQRAALEAIATDMWEPYLLSIRAHVPDADQKIVFDRFHIMKHITEAVDKVRRQEHRALEREDGESPLTGTKRLWLYAAENLPERYRPEFARLQALDLKVGRAWAIKENLRALWRYRAPGWAQRFFQRWYWWATHSRLQPVQKVARMLKRHLANIVTYARHRLTNAVAEGLNSKIQGVIKTACGFRNLEHFKVAILFHCGGLDLYPH